MAHGQERDPNEKVVFVGDSRVRKNTKVYTPADYTSFPGKSEAFIPNFLLKEWMVGAVVLVGFLVLTISEPAPLGYPADPTNAAFIPMPDWYFLFLYQLLKYAYTSDKFVVMGTVILPALMFGALTLAPFLDTGKERRFYRRPIASSLFLLTLVACTYLTLVSWHHYEYELELTGQVPEHIQRELDMEKANKKAEAGIKEVDPADLKIVAADDPAFEFAKTATCISCHGVDLKGNKNAGFPALLGVGDLHSKDEIVAIIKDGYKKMPSMYDTAKSNGLSDDDIDALATWLSKQKAADAQ